MDDELKKQINEDIENIYVEGIKELDLLHDKQNGIFQELAKKIDRQKIERLRHEIKNNL